MVELFVRLAAAGCALALAFSPSVSLEFAGQAAGAFAAVSVFAFLLEKRDLRTPLFSAVISTFDAAIIASLLSRAGQMDRFGCAAAIPVLWAAVRHQASPAMAAPLAAGAMMASQNLFGTVGVTWPAGVNAAIVAILGLLAQQSQKIITITRVEHEPAPIAPPQPQPEAPDDYLELRESFRQLKDHASQLERRSRRDRVSAQAAHAVISGIELGYSALAKRLQDITGALGLTLYSISQHGDRMVVRSVSGDVPNELQTASFEVPRTSGEGHIRRHIDDLLKSVKGSSESASGSVLVKARGRITGMICLISKNHESLDEGRTKLEEAADTLGLLVKLLSDREEETRRLREAELLYTVACTGSGSDTPSTLCQRVIRELGEILPADYLSITAFDDKETLSLARKGQDIPIFEPLSFGYGSGIQGWTACGAPEVAMHDAKSDPRLDGREAVKRRIGSLILIPIQSGSQPEAVLAAMSHRMHGLDAGHLETLRIVGSELGQALGRLTSSDRPSEGLATPKELFSAVQASGSGCLVYMEIPRREELIETYGRAGVSHAIAKFAQRIRAKLPAGALLCRRDEGDYVAFLRGADERSAASWANEAAATASMIGLTTPDGRAKIPLALKCKTASIDRASLKNPEQEKAIA